MTKDILVERSEILSEFNKDEISQLLDTQLANIFTESNGIPVDYFKPLYYRYQEMKNMEMNEDLRADLDSEFNKIALLFINSIEKRFNIKVSEEWLSYHESSIASIALLLYEFFVLELNLNIEDVVHHFMKADSENLYSMFEDRKGKKDGSTTLYSKTASPEMAVLLANIYDVSTHIIETLTEEEYFENLPPDYVPNTIIKDLYKKGTITGNFMEVIREYFSSTSYLKSVVCFNITKDYRK